MFLKVGTRVGNLFSFLISLSEQPVAYTTPGTMGQRSLARNFSGANEGLEGTPYNVLYGETPLKKRKRKDIGKEKGRDNCHLVPTFFFTYILTFSFVTRLKTARFLSGVSPYCGFYGVPSRPSLAPGEFLARENPFETSPTDEPNNLLIQALSRAGGITFS